MTKMADNDQILTTNNQLRDRLKEVKLLIETSIEQYMQRYGNRYSNKENKEEEDNNILKDALLFQETVEHYKEIITQLQDQLSMGYSNRKLQEKENELKNHQSQLEVIRNENKSLKIIKKRQAKGINDFENRYNNKVERIVLNEKQKNLKQECKIMRDYNESQVLTIKKQQNDINALLSHSELVKANIQRKKRLNGLVDNEEDDPLEMNSLRDQALQVEMNAKNEELNYIAQIKKQKDHQNRLDEDIAIIKLQIKQKEQEIRISELKCKEVKRLKYHSKILNTQLNRMKNNNTIMTKNMYSGNRSFSSVNEPRSKAIINKEKSTQFIKRNLNAEVESDNENEKSRVMYEIEDLKNDIQIAINKNDPNEIFTRKKREEVKMNEINQYNSDVKADSFEYLAHFNKEGDDDYDYGFNEQNKIDPQHNALEKKNNNQKKEGEDEIEEEIEGNRAYNFQIEKDHNEVYIEGDLKKSRKPFGDFGFPKE